MFCYYSYTLPPPPIGSRTIVLFTVHWEMQCHAVNDHVTMMTRDSGACEKVVGLGSVVNRHQQVLSWVRTDLCTRQKRKEKKSKNQRSDSHTGK